MFGSQGAVQLLNDAAGGQLWVQRPEVRGPGGCGDPASQQRAMRVFGQSEVPG